MQIIKRNKMTLLLAEEGKLIRDINDIYTEATIDEEGNEIPENIPYRTDTIILPPTITEEEINNLYVEEDK